MRAEGTEFRTNAIVGENIDIEVLRASNDAIVLACGATAWRDLNVAGRELAGIHQAMEYLPLANKVQEGDMDDSPINVHGKHVVVIGGGDTGSDCVGTSNRQGAASVTQFELMPQPPEHENKALTWPYWPTKMRTSSSHEEGCERDWSITTKSFSDDGKGNVRALVTARVEWRRDESSGQMKMIEVPGSEQEVPADMVLFAMGFVAPAASVLEAFGVERDARGNARAHTEGDRSYRTNHDKVFAAGDMRRGQSLVVWAIREGRQAAHSVDAFLMGASDLPR
jgi:glutamate synthase (NADPH/NADH) small chain